MLRRTLSFCLATAVGLCSCAHEGAAPDAKPAPAAPVGIAATPPSPADPAKDADTGKGTAASPGADPAAAPKPGTPVTTEGLVKFVLGIQGKVGKLSELEKTLGLDFQYNADRASSEIQIKDGAQQTIVSLLLEPAPRIVTGAWGRSEPDRNFDPRVTMIRLQVRTGTPPMTKDGKEIFAVGSDKREVWAWGRFFYLYSKQDTEWIIEWSKEREDFHVNAADVTKFREALHGVAKVMGKGFSFSGHFAKTHAAAAVTDTPDLFDFRSAEVFAEGTSMEVHFLNETQIDGFFKALGIAKISFSFAHDKGHSPVPVQAKGCEVTVTKGSWPDSDKKGINDQNGPAATIRVKSMSIDCG